MTLLDFCRLLKHHIALVVVLPIVCALGCFAVLMVSHGADMQYSAVSRIMVSTYVQDVAGLAAGEVRAATVEHPDMQIKSSVDVNTKTVTVTVAAKSEQDAIKLANEIAETACSEAEDFVPNNADDPFNARVEKALDAKSDASKGGNLKYVLVALLAGLLVAICIVVVIDMKKRPVISIESVQDAVNLPVLEELPITDGGERLLANVRFASNVEVLREICIVPIGSGDTREAVVEALANAAKSEGLSVCAGMEPNKSVDISFIRCQSLLQGIKAAYAARNADATVIVANQWTDSMRNLESTAAELRLAGANVIGVVFSK